MSLSTAQLPKKLLYFDRDLPVLGIEAASELDNYLLKRKGTFAAVKRLAELLGSSLGPCVGGHRRYALDASSTILLSKAIETYSHKKVTTLVSLARTTEAVAERLNKAKASSVSIDEEIARLRDFCIALSRSAGASRQSVSDHRPGHPHRR